MLHMHTVHSGCVVDLGGRGGVTLGAVGSYPSASPASPFPSLLQLPQPRSSLPSAPTLPLSAASVLPPKCSHLTIVLPLHMLACLLQTRCLG